MQIIIYFNIITYEDKIYTLEGRKKDLQILTIPLSKHLP